MIKVIIFDFDGVIADSFGLFLRVANEFAPKFGYEPMDYAEAQKLRDLSAREVLKKLNLSLLRFIKIRRKMRGKLAEEITQAKPVKGIANVLEDLKSKNYKLGIMTTNNIGTVRKFLEHYNLEVFDFVYQEKSVFGKGRLIKKYLTKEKLGKEEVIVVDDEIRGIDAARFAGIKIISVTWGYNSKKALKKAKPDFLVDSPADILARLGLLE